MVVNGFSHLISYLHTCGGNSALVITTLSSIIDKTSQAHSTSFSMFILICGRAMPLHSKTMRRRYPQWSAHPGRSLFCGEATTTISSVIASHTPAVAFLWGGYHCTQVIATPHLWGSSHYQFYCQCFAHPGNHGEAITALQYDGGIIVPCSPRVTPRFGSLTNRPGNATGDQTVR